MKRMKLCMAYMIFMLPLIILFLPLYADVNTRKGWEPATFARLERFHRFDGYFFEVWDFDISDLVRGTQQRRYYMVIGGSWWGSTMQLVRSHDDGHLTPAVAVEHIGHRMASLFLCMLAGTVWLVVKLRPNASRASAPPAPAFSNEVLMRHLRPPVPRYDTVASTGGDRRVGYRRDKVANDGWG